MVFTSEELIDRAFLRATTVMYGMWEERGSSDTRLLLPPLIPDEYVIVGESMNGKEHKEHVVPRVVIINECHKMFNVGQGLDNVASFVRKYLKIVYISRQEQERLDKRGSGFLNLRQKMPKGWSFDGGDMYARFIEAGIVVNFYQKPGKPQSTIDASPEVIS